jgi:hypothetical protein
MPRKYCACHPSRGGENPAGQATLLQGSKPNGCGDVDLHMLLLLVFQNKVHFVCNSKAL